MKVIHVNFKMKPLPKMEACPSTFHALFPKDQHCFST